MLAHRAVTALAGLLLTAPLVSAAPAGATTDDPPGTYLSRVPVDPTTSRRAIFEFYSDSSPVSFRCRLDRRRWRWCWIEAKYRGLAPGRHVFRVRAVQDGVPDPTPARFVWRVLG